MRPLAGLFVLIAFAMPAAAQVGNTETDAEWLEHCRTDWGRSERGHACEVRAVPVKLAGRSLDIDGNRNGSIRVEGWDGDSVRVTARLQSNARSDEEAARLLSEVRISADGRSVRADGPAATGDDERSWAAGYVVYVPRRFDLSLSAHNGSLRVADVQGRMELRTQNGSVVLAGVGGEVHARTQNGSLNVQLAGERWEGAGLDAETRNGAVRLTVPERYVGTLETGTVNGRINTEIPVTVRGNVGRELTIPLNGGGTRIHATTTNGSVTLRTR